MLLAAPLLALSTAVAPPLDPPGQVRYRNLLEGALERRVSYTRNVDLWSDHSSWDNAWVVDSERYTVRTTQSYYLAKSIGEGLDAMLGHMGELLDSSFAPSTRYQVWIFPTLQQYNDFGDANGAEHSSMLGAYYAGADAQRPIAAYYNPNQTLLMMWLTHAATHQYVQGAFGAEPDVPIMEGLASYFTLFWDWSYGAREHQRLKSQGGGFVPLAQLMRDPIGNYVRNSHDRFMELGMFFNYLLHYLEETALVPDGEQPEASFAEYLRAVVRGRDASDLGFNVFLEYIDAVEADFRNFDFPE